MAKTSGYLKADELKTPLASFKNLELQIGKVILEEEEWEPMGPTPMPSLARLRPWTVNRLLKRYKPYYAPFCDRCCLCTYGHCDLTAGKEGACGITIDATQGRIVLLACIIGASAHTAHARHLLNDLIERVGPDHPVDLGNDIEVEAPVIRNVTGIRPRRLGDLEEVLDYVEGQIVHSASATHTGQEGSYIDFEAKAMHVSLMDAIGMEAADLIQITSLDFPKGEGDVPLVDIGLGCIDTTKPAILVIGHNVMPSVGVIDYLREHKLEDSVEVAGICCTAIDLTRYDPGYKVVGSIARQQTFIRSGVPDVVMVDEQCIRTDNIKEVAKIKAAFIATNEKNCMGLSDRTEDPVQEIVDDLVKYAMAGEVNGALILDPDKAGEVAVRTAMKLAPLRNKFKNVIAEEQIIELAKECTGCYECERACPNDAATTDAIKAAAEGDLTKLAALYEPCIGCGRCTEACSKGIPVKEMIDAAADNQIKQDRYRVRVGRGPIKDTEIRNVGAPIVLGEIPGVVAYVGCANYPAGPKEVALMAEEFLKRRYIVVTSGCSAMDIARYRDEEGLTLYEKYHGDFDAGGLVNVGSCVSNPHITGAAIKIANIFARRPLRANFEEIADYVLNRVGAVGVAWGAYSQKAASIATGVNIYGIPVIVGPHGSKYRRMLLGRPDIDEDWYVYNARTGEKVYVGPTPEHLMVAVENMDECIVETAKLCMRPNDTFKGRAIKLSHWIDLYRRKFGKDFPDDVHKYIRVDGDIPLTFKEDLLKVLKDRNWQSTEIPDPTLYEKFVKLKAKK
ncbi:MAG: CO dehydrogenase/acetyl-CoA synthase complex subunit alpha [Candidatus Jordarchaeum sp.]|uniref:CO dehydrogenase/acetyl-CoA synthase complex subunit alpha n=1 Tax=Candidatus Jordarchaeum sp. TaxID=2823881 RepID=UPI00404AC3C2